MPQALPVRIPAFVYVAYVAAVWVLQDEATMRRRRVSCPRQHTCTQKCNVLSNHCLFHKYKIKKNRHLHVCKYVYIYIVREYCIWETFSRAWRCLYFGNLYRLDGISAEVLENRDSCPTFRPCFGSHTIWVTQTALRTSLAASTPEPPSTKHHPFGCANGHFRLFGVPRFVPQIE